MLSELCNIDGQAIPVVLLSAQGANTAYADRVRAALSKSRSSIDSLIAILNRRLGIQAAQDEADPDGGGPVHETGHAENNSNDQEVA